VNWFFKILKLINLSLIGFSNQLNSFYQL